MAGARDADQEPSATGRVASAEDLSLRFQSRKFGDEAADVIRQLILTGEIRAGQRLNEVALSQSLGISRSPIREALNALAGEGLVNFVAGRGAYVPEFDLERVRQLGQARQALECSAARLAAELASDDDLTEMETLLAATEGSLERDAGQYPHVLDFHSLVLRAGKNQVIEQLASSVNVQLRLARLVSGQNPRRAREAFHEHRFILDALVRRDPEAAASAMFEHLAHAVLSAEHSMSASSDVHG